MKNNTLSLAVLLTLPLLFAACEPDGRTPLTDNTKLWPAYCPTANRYGYINQTGEMVIQPIFIGASSFSCGYALVGNKEQVYFIDTKGQTQQGRYDNAYSFNNGYARVSLDYKWGCINTDMNMLVQPEYNHMREMSDGMVAVTMLCDMWGYVNDKGEVAIPITPTYIQVGNFYQGLAPVRNDELKWGCINKNNDYVIPPVYDWLEDFHEGLAAFYRNEKWGFLNTSGVEITPAIYEQAYHFFNGLAPVLKNGKWGFINTNGEEVIPTIYNHIDYFYENGLAPVCIGDKWGYIDKKGKLKIPAIYDGANPFSEGLALVCDTDDNGTGITYYVINTKGKIQFSIADHYFPSKIPYFHNGVILMVNRHCPYDPYFYRYYDRKGNCIYEWKDGYQYEWETEEHKPYAAPAEVISIEQKYQRIINQNYQLGK